MRCANPQCQTESNYLRDGSLYSIDDLLAGSGLPQRRFIWLCSQCTGRFSVQTWRPPGQQLVLKPTAGEGHGATARSAPRPQPRHNIPPRPATPVVKQRAHA